MFRKYKVSHACEEGCHYPLHNAIRNSENVLIKVTPEMNTNFDLINRVDQDRNTALHLAVERGYKKWVDYLLANKADVNMLNKFGMNPLMLAVRHQYPDIALLLLRHEANVNFVNDKGQTALHYACCTENDACLKYLLKYNAKLNIQDQDGVTPLIMACKMRQPTMVKMLLSYKIVAKVNPNLCDKLGRSPLHWAAEQADACSTEALINSNANLNAMDGDMETPFVRAIKKNSLNVLDVLIKAGCDRTNIDGLNGTAMTMATLLGRNEVILKLIEVGEDVNELGHIGHTPLTSAVFESHIETVRLLLDNGADPNLASRSGSTPLLKANFCIRQCNVEQRHEIVKLLLRANADTNICSTMAGFFTSVTNGRNCPLSFAITSGCKSLVMMQLIAGSRFTAADVVEWMNMNSVEEWFEEDKILRPIYNWAITVRSLKSQCRKCIRECFGRMVHKKISLLPIPEAIIQYINFEELDHIEVEFDAPKNSICNQRSPAMNTALPCGLATLQGTLSYEVLVNPAIGFQNT